MCMKYNLWVLCTFLAAGWVGIGCTVSNGATSQVKEMTSKEARAAQILELPAAEYFPFDEDKQVKLQEALAALMDGDDLPGETRAAPSPILVLGAPERVNLDGRSIVPLLVGRLQSGLRAWEVNYETNLHLFVKDLATGELRITQPLMDICRGQMHLLSGAGKPPDGLKAQTLHSSLTFIDLQKKWEGGMKPGRYRVTAVAYELLSNRVEIHLESNSVPSRKPARTMPPPCIKHTLVKTVPLETEIVLPQKTSMDRQDVIDAAIQIIKEAGVYRADSGEIFWTCNLIFVKLDEQPEIVPVSIPVQAVSALDGRSACNAVFQIDLSALMKARTFGNYQVYMDMGTEVIGPYPLTFDAV